LQQTLLGLLIGQKKLVKHALTTSEGRSVTMQWARCDVKEALSSPSAHSDHDGHIAQANKSGNNETSKQNYSRRFKVDVEVWI
jgi:hypothetical protein